MGSTGQTQYPAPRGAPPVELAGPFTGFGELRVASPEPTSQVGFVYSLNPLLVTSYAYGAGASVSTVNGELTLASGTATDGYARLISKKVAKYRAGQATLVRWTARFTAGSTGNRQMAGAYNIEAGYQFGYNGTVFGILYTEAATVEVQTLTVTAAPTGAGNVTVTLNGGAGVVVAVTTSGNTSVTASQIAAADYAQVSGGWDAQAVANVVYFTRRLPGPAGASTFAAGATGMTATFAILTAGVSPTEQFIPQASWNGVPLVIDPTKGNVYAVACQYLGYGDAFFYIEDGSTGQFVLVHTIKNANTRTSTNLRNPNLYLTWESRNTGTGTSVTARGASGAAFVEGPIRFLGAQFSVQGTVTLGGGVETPVLSVRGSTVHKARVSTAQIQIDRISVACDGVKTVAFKVYKNGTLTAARWQEVNTNTSAASYDAQSTAFALGTGTLVYAFSVAKAGNATESLTDVALFLQAGDTLTITATSANASDVTASVVWIEDI
jgi:hypothetical protein